MTHKLLFTIQPEHVGSSRVKVSDCDNADHDRVIHLSGFGVVQTIDVGKRVYVVDGVIQVENNQQRDERQDHEHALHRR
jgi:hypothetical protein